MAPELGSERRGPVPAQAITPPPQPGRFDSGHTGRQGRPQPPWKAPVTA